MLVPIVLTLPCFVLVCHRGSFSFWFCQVADNSDSSAALSEDGVNVKDAEAVLPLVDFGMVVAGKERFDVCRLFLASLQLVGHGCHE